MLALDTMIEVALNITSITSDVIKPLTLALCIIYVLRRAGKKRGRESRVNRLNRMLRKIHIPLGITLIVVSLLHGIAAWLALPHVSREFTALDFPWGLAGMVFLLGLAASYLLRKKLKPNWLRWHRVLTLCFLLTVVLHIGLEAQAIQAEEHQIKIPVDQSAAL
jgi:cytochrome b561